VDPSKKQRGCFYQTRQRDMAHVAKHFKAFRMGSDVWVPGSSCLAQRRGQGPGSTGINEGGGTYMGFNLIRRLQLVFPASPCFPAQMDHSGVQEAEVWPEDWAPRGSVRAYIGGLGRYSMIMIQLSIYDQFPKQKDFGLNPILTGSCASSTFTPSSSSSVWSIELVPPKLSSWK